MSALNKNDKGFKNLLTTIGTHAKSIMRGTAAVFLALAAACALPSAALAAEGTQTIWRVYNPNSGEHMYTPSKAEYNSLGSLGWKLEGASWAAPANDGAPIYRMYNQNSGEHLWTTNYGECTNLMNLGPTWRYEGQTMISGGDTAVYRLYNPNASAFQHHWTTSVGERDHLVSLGWRNEGVAFYASSTDAPTTNMLKVNGTYVPYTIPSQSQRGANSAPDSGAYLWWGDDSTTDGSYGYFIGHNPGSFTPVMSLSVGDVITVWDSVGNKRSYTVTDAFDSTSYTLSDSIKARLFGKGESVIFQTCTSFGNRFVLAQA